MDFVVRVQYFRQSTLEVPQVYWLCVDLDCLAQQGLREFSAY